MSSFEMACVYEIHSKLWKSLADKQTKYTTPYRGKLQAPFSNFPKQNYTTARKVCPPTVALVCITPLFLYALKYV